MHDDIACQHSLFVELLPESLGTYSVSYYLLYKMIDAIEDSNLRVAVKIDLLERISQSLIWGLEHAKSVLSDHIGVPEHCRKLYRNSDAIFDLFFSLPKPVRRKIEDTGEIKANGLLDYLLKDENSSVRDDRRFLKDFMDLDSYCFYSAGCVGELNTQLFADAKSFSLQTKTKVMDYGIELGNYVQLVNVIRDHVVDKNDNKRDCFPISIAELDEIDQLHEMIGFARGKEEKIGKFVNALRDDDVKVYCSTLFEIARLHFDFYSQNPGILHAPLKLSVVALFASMPLKLKINYVYYKLRKLVV